MHEMDTIRASDIHAEPFAMGSRDHHLHHLDFNDPASAFHSHLPDSLPKHGAYKDIIGEALGGKNHYHSHSTSIDLDELIASGSSSPNGSPVLHISEHEDAASQLDLSESGLMEQGDMSMTPITIPIVLPPGGTTVIDGVTYNNRGYEVCGALNKFNKPCQRIGKCPFHPNHNKKEVDIIEQRRLLPIKKGPYKSGWKKDEHLRFLKGLQIHGRGSWKDIALVVGTRTPTQIQVHAHRYYLRQMQGTKNKRSIHDISLEDLEELEGKHAVMMSMNGMEVHDHVLSESGSMNDLGSPSLSHHHQLHGADMNSMFPYNHAHTPHNISLPHPSNSIPNASSHSHYHSSHTNSVHQMPSNSHVHVHSQPHQLSHSHPSSMHHLQSHHTRINGGSNISNSSTQPQQSAPSPSSHSLPMFYTPTTPSSTIPTSPPLHSGSPLPGMSVLAGSSSLPPYSMPHTWFNPASLSLGHVGQSGHDSHTGMHHTLHHDHHSQHDHFRGLDEDDDALHDLTLPPPHDSKLLSPIHLPSGFDHRYDDDELDDEFLTES